MLQLNGKAVWGGLEDEPVRIDTDSRWIDFNETG